MRSWARFLDLDHCLEFYELFAAVKEVKKMSIYLVNQTKVDELRKKHNLRHGLLTSTPHDT